MFIQNILDNVEKKNIEDKISIENIQNIGQINLYNWAYNRIER